MTTITYTHPAPTNYVSEMDKKEQEVCLLLRHILTVSCSGTKLRIECILFQPRLNASVQMLLY